ncbi:MULTISPECIES: VOC family protein [unclassified Micromonospora]|uniref:VOC family protein n=1 Tax=unclassified Micromonospora TaxID=2617518 RepID=UPI0033243F19
MQYAPVVVSLPIADRPTSYRFYAEGLGLDAVGEPAEDGIPEPLQFALNDGLRIMLVPTGGFGWVIGSHEVARRGQSECVLSLPAATPAEVAQLVERARSAGAEVVVEPGRQPWGYTGAFTDPDGHLWMVSAEAA